MPTGTQQTIDGLVCEMCSLIIEEQSNDSEIICSNCEDELINSCDFCSDTAYNLSNTSYMQNLVLRRAGVEMQYFYYTNDGDTACQDCVWWCSECNEPYSYEETMLECCSIHNNHVHNYGYKPRPMFYSCQNDGPLAITSTAAHGVLYMGIELEIAKMQDLADEFYDSMTADEKDFVYMKEDGSIGPDGVELVTHPATIDAFKKVFPFEPLDQARADGARSFAYSSCGFHIHVSRSAFTATHMWKFIKFQMQQPQLCQTVAQREESSYATWYFEDVERRDLPEYIKGKKANGRRYLAINFQNHNTVELRYFKGNILRSAIMKNLEFVQSIYDYTKGLTVRDIASGALSDIGCYYEWLDSTEGYDNLKYFLSNNQNKESE